MNTSHEKNYAGAVEPTQKTVQRSTTNRIYNLNQLWPDLC